MNKTIILSLLTLGLFSASCQQKTHTLYLDELDMGKIESQWGKSKATKVSMEQL